MDTFIAKLPANWSAYWTTNQIKQYIEVYGEDVALSKLVTYLHLQENLKAFSEGAKKKQLSSTVYYNQRTKTVNVLGTGKKVTKKKISFNIPPEVNW